MSKGARVRQQKSVQAPQKRSGKGRAQTPRPPGQTGLSRRTLYIGVIAAAGLLAVILVVGSILSSSSNKPPAGNIPITSAAAIKLLAGIKQNGTTLGNPNAPVTMQEFGDLQCPNCAQYSGAAFPTLVRDYVRTGKVKMEFNGMAFLGPDSEKALRFALAAGRQNKLWNVVDLLYANQGTENTGWVTDNMLASIGKNVPGLDVTKAFAARNDGSITTQMGAAAKAYDAYGFPGTPGFAAGPTGGNIQRFEPTAYDPSAFRPTLDKLLAQQKQQ